MRKMGVQATAAQPLVLLVAVSILQGDAQASRQMLPNHATVLNNTVQ